ncbi:MULTISPECIES: transcriptional regulator [Yersinia]|nr:MULTISPECIES: helix-turn-helix domain-containing protein [Yersinia]ARZ01344.1 phage transcriptional regulator [Yersinia ruckeri]EKN4697367.1 helix-turn-helix domain-containing protein [Yersinia ruckeri]KFE38867.1 antirepressor [Yersinia ruckeri]MCW6569634.1 helix-turn-helix domain-containing protein [Yersinia ruckeri]OWF85536.1 transcriptional regulator [Yersinia entomophaga]
MNNVIKMAIRIVGTQKGLAEACGVTQAAVQKWLSGKTKVAPRNVKSLVEATNGEVQAHQVRPDLPNLFPHPDLNAIRTTEELSVSTELNKTTNQE